MIELALSQDVSTVIAATAAALRRGETAVIPTDTVYGLACDPRRPEAVEEVFRMKGRPGGRRLPVIVTGVGQARGLGLRWTDAADRLAAEFWPGPLTIAVGVERQEAAWLAGRDEVGLRAPASELALGLAEELGPFFMTSANRHGHATPSSLADALADLASPPGVAVDGGTLPVVSSSLVNVNLPAPEVEREGVVPTARLQEVLGLAGA